MKTLVQCDFDGTITEDDASSVLLDLFAQGDWRRLLRQYEQGEISVQELNTRSFAMVKADRAALLEALNGRVKVRPGFREFVSYCSDRLFRLAIVSNGLEFYIRAILRDLNLENMEVFSAQAVFRPEGIEVRYVGPDGLTVADGFKESYTKLFLEQGYRVIYMGNGDSDVAPSKHAHHVFATGRLLAYGRENDLDFEPLADFADVVRRMELLQ
ncbi:MAG: MtnX-like HAD-IB family phosphatase [Dehalococcoidia bacterium]|nr:MtnX-like HAD-IB family phosphatase [Dehalococcoidia bacterium]